MAGRREKMLALAAGVVLALWVLDGYVLSPLLELRRNQITKAQKLEEQFHQSERLLSQSRSAQRRLRAMRTQGQLGRDASTTESGLLVAIQGWARESRVQLLSIRPDRATAGRGVRELSFQASGDGSLQAVTDFLYRLDTAKVPVRVRELQLSPRTEGSDDLSMTLRLSSIWEDVPQTTTTADQPALSSAAAEVAP